MGRDIQFSREPYTIRYMKDGKLEKIRRVPPPKLHSALPEDVVELTETKNADFKAGQTFTVQDINPRQPNVLKIVNEDGLSTFVDHYDMKLKEKGPYVVGENGKIQENQQIDSDYLLWP